MEVTTERIYRDKELALASFLGGPLAIGYLIAENFKVFEQRDKVRITWIATLLSTVVIFASPFLVPALEKIPNFIVPLVYTTIAYALVNRFQGERIEAHIDAGGEVHSWKRTIGVGLIGLVITLVALLGTGLVVDAIVNADITSKTYGRMQHEISFDTTNIPEREVDRIAYSLRLGGFFDDEVTKYVHVEKVGNDIELYISVADGAAADNTTLTLFRGLLKVVQERSPDNRVYLNLVVERLDNVVKRMTMGD
ncbi:hypothetical protein GCM10007415_42340 [Parapedobacter pyrenivorans]|uniref:Uncharacterized protein n=1 Tax=Parapedobacter pyrenivorans TaxID=1305674 RepID=A0A917I1X4_9SPHI|nr:hypothetical protein [Parapedobacter pyrenivorans]GGH01743.1 hypothetical protein GCM10007415_42340 [Parapedobacter pyrenivorans]